MHLKLKYISLLLILLTSCQTHKSVNIDRSVASINNFRRFIGELASYNQVQRSVPELEEEALRYILRSSRGQGNWEQIGISELEAHAIRSLDDSASFMPKVRRWIMRNAHRVFTRVRVNQAAAAYDVAMQNRSSLFNPYRRAGRLSETITNLQRRVLPGRAHPEVLMLSERINTLISRSRSFGAHHLSPAVKGDLNESLQFIQEALTSLTQRGVHASANAVEITRSAELIARKTGRPSMARGCEAFLEHAPLAIIAKKADIDGLTAEIIETMAHNKAGRYFNDYSEIAAARRLTTSEIDQARVEAMRMIHNISHERALAKLNRAKSSPCQLYP